MSLRDTDAESTTDVASTSTSRRALPPWPLRGRELLELVSAYAVLVIIGLAVGFFIVGQGPGSALVEWDTEVSRWWAEQRSADWNAPSDTGSALADTFNIVGAVAVLAIGLTLWWRRWKESLTLTVALMLEALVFVTISLTVGRDRPPVEQMDVSPATASFPSGHTGAAFAFYLGIVAIVWWRTDALWIRITSLVLGLGAAVIVALSRLYRGMHFVTDVTVGAVLGIICLAVAAVVVERGIDRRKEHT